jgi:hypothetical protein
MIREELIPVNYICIHHNIEISFIHSLQSSGLIEVITEEETECVPVNQIPQLEKIIRLYHEMDINIEGIETILHLLQQIDDLKKEIQYLNNRLSLYEQSNA